MAPNTSPQKSVACGTALWYSTASIQTEYQHMEADVIIRIRHPIENIDATVIETNTCRAVVQQVLANFITSQCGKRADRHKPPVRHEYRIILTHTPGTNRFVVAGDTDHNALTVGIIMRIVEHWDRISIKPLLQ